MTDIEIRLEAERLYRGMEQASDEGGLGSIKQLKPPYPNGSIASMAAAMANIHMQSKRASNTMRRQIILVSRPFGPWRRAAFAASFLATIVANKRKYK